MTTKIIAPSVPVSSLLGILFIGLKLTGYVTWSWLWVLSPFWIPLALCMVIMALALFVGIIAAFLGVA